MIVLGWAVQATAAASTGPANPSASPDAKRILAYYYGLTARPDHRVISGQFTAWSPNEATGYQNEVAGLYNATGKWPALVGYDLRGGLDLKQPIQAWRAGHLITLSYHFDNPIVGGDAKATGGDLAELLKPGSAAALKWRQTLDETAGNLKKLQDSGVVVLWRPFHEQNGGWFWWGGKDVAAFVALWKDMFTYFTQVKGLNNLLWVFAPNIGNGPGKYYPGDAFVDIVGLDAYFNRPSALNLADYGTMTAFRKPFGLTEFGPVPPAGGPTKVWDNAILIRDIKAKYPQTCFYMNWHSPWSTQAQDNPEGLMNDTWIIDRDHLDWKGSIVIGINPYGASGATHPEGDGLLSILRARDRDWLGPFSRRNPPTPSGPAAAEVGLGRPQ